MSRLINVALDTALDRALSGIECPLRLHPVIRVRIKGFRVLWREECLRCMLWNVGDSLGRWDCSRHPWKVVYERS